VSARTEVDVTRPARRARDCAIVRDPAVWVWMVVLLLALVPFVPLPSVLG